MSDEKPAAGPAAGETEAGQAAHELAAALRRLKRWLIVLTVLVALLGAAMIVVAVWCHGRSTKRARSLYRPMPGPWAHGRRGRLDRQDVQSALGDRLGEASKLASSPEVRRPISTRRRPGDQQFIYVQFQVKGST